jgi:hypothetical protein
LACEVLAGLLGQGTDVLWGDHQTGQRQSVGGIDEGTQASRGLSDQPPGGGTVGVVVQAQERSLGGKSPAGRQDSGRPVRSG